jgi:hypothetical protein
MPMVLASDRRESTAVTNDFRLGVTHDARTVAGGEHYVQASATRSAGVTLRAVTQVICQALSHACAVV